jgi:hypothetical protein
VNLTPLVAKAELRRGARLEIRVTRPGYVGVVSIWKSRSPRTPKHADRCLPPGKTQPTRC